MRAALATRLSMLLLAGNFCHNRRFASTWWWCSCSREAREEEEHVRDSCPFYNDREQFDNVPL